MSLRSMPAIRSKFPILGNWRRLLQVAGPYRDENLMASAAQSASPVASRERAEGGALTADIPARLDRLPWSRFHLLVVVALVVTWILDGLEVTIVGAIAPVLQSGQTLGLSAGDIGAAGSAYLIGAVVGALLFGWLTDRFGRRLVFYVTLIVY